MNIIHSLYKCSFSPTDWHTRVFVHGLHSGEILCIHKDTEDLCLYELSTQATQAAVS